MTSLNGKAVWSKYEFNYNCIFPIFYYYGIYLKVSTRWANTVHLNLEGQLFGAFSYASAMSVGMDMLV